MTGGGMLALSAIAIISAALAWRSPSIWSGLAATVLNGVVAWYLLGVYLGR